MNNAIHLPHMAPIKVAAAQSGLAEHHVRQLCITGKICSVRAGNKWLVNMDRLAEYLNTGDTGSGAAPIHESGVIRRVEG